MNQQLQLFVSQEGRKRFLYESTATGRCDVRYGSVKVMEIYYIESAPNSNVALASAICDLLNKEISIEN